jgi:hypothetical protein
MAAMMEGYVDVAERIRQLREKHPEAVLRPWNPDEPFKIVMIGNREFIVYTAACYRTPDDPMPAVAVAAEPAVGKTSFTRDSEVMNAETSAWGRAIVAALAADTQKIASMEEVRNRRSDEAETSVKKHPARPQKAPVVSTEEAASMLTEAFGGEVIAAPSAEIKRISGITSGQRELINKIAGEANIDDLGSIIKTLFEVDSLDDLNSPQASTLIGDLRKRKAKR